MYYLIYAFIIFHIILQENNNSVIPVAPVKLTLSTFSLKKLQVELIVNLQYDFLIE